MRFFNAEKQAERGTTRTAKVRKTVSNITSKTAAALKKAATATGRTIARPFKSATNHTPPKIRRVIHRVSWSALAVLLAAAEGALTALCGVVAFQAAAGVVAGSTTFSSVVLGICALAFFVSRMSFLLGRLFSGFHKAGQFIAKVLAPVFKVVTWIVQVAFVTAFFIGLIQLLATLSAIDPSKVVLPTVAVVVIVYALYRFAKREFKAALAEQEERRANDLMDGVVYAQFNTTGEPQYTEHPSTGTKGKKTPKQPRQGQKDSFYVFMVDLEELQRHLDNEVKRHVSVLVDHNQLDSDTTSLWCNRLYNLALKEQGVNDPSLRAKATRVFRSEVLQVV